MVLEDPQESLENLEKLESKDLSVQEENLDHQVPLENQEILVLKVCLGFKVSQDGPDLPDPQDRLEKQYQLYQIIWVAMDYLVLKEEWVLLDLLVLQVNEELPENEVQQEEWVCLEYQEHQALPEDPDLPVLKENLEKMVNQESQAENTVKMIYEKFVHLY